MADGQFKKNEKTLFSGNDILVTSNLFDGANDVLVVCFPSAEAKPALNRRGFGSKWLHGLGISSVSVKVSYNHWFQTPETDVALAEIEKVARTFKRVITYGSSMGAYGAIACSKGVGAHAALAVSPQWSINPSRAPWDKRWLAHSTLIEARHGFIRDNLGESAAHSDICVVADPWDIDARHARLILADIPTARWIQIPGGGHPAMSLLKEYQMVSRFVRSILLGEFTSKEWRPEIRVKRRTSARYWLSLAKASSSRGPRGAALAGFAAEHALTLADPADKNIRTAGRVLLNMEDLDAAARIFERYAGASDESAVTIALRAHTLLRLGRMDEARPLIEIVAVRDPGNKRLPALRRAIQERPPAAY